MLIALMIWTPYQFASASMIGTDQVATAPTQVDRTIVTNFLNRSDVAQQLQSLGLSSQAAQDRVASLSDQEVQQLAGKIQSLPAGADTGDVVVGILVVAAIVVVVWYLWKRM